MIPLALRALCLLVAVLSLPGTPPPVSAGAQEEQGKPNIILFLVDDMGWQDTSVPFHDEITPFNRRYRTPNMERLAGRGVVFTNAYASAPVCTPTRTSIMTGQSPGQTHITWWTLHRDRDTSRKHPTLSPPAWEINGLQSSAVTLPGVLQDAGYRTIHVGKAHFGARETSGADPRNLGFDINIAGHAAGAPGSYYGTHYYSASKRSNGGSVWDVPGLEEYHGTDTFLTEALTYRASAAIRGAVASGTPFYMNFAPYAVHAPIMANRRYLDTYTDLDQREAAYSTMIESMDTALGSIMDLLEELDIAQQTIIVFSSDNGGLSAHARGGTPHTHNAPLRSGKGSAYEGGVRVPAIISWPGTTDDPTRCDVPIVSHDFFPTILGFAGAGIPAAYAASVEGRDLSPLLTGAVDRFDRQRVICWNQPHRWGANGPGIWPYTAIRMGDWKLIYAHAEQRLELYNLAEDISESHDVTEGNPDRVLALARRLGQWCRRYDVQMSIDSSSGDPVPYPDVVAERLFPPTVP